MFESIKNSVNEVMESVAEAKKVLKEINEHSPEIIQNAKSISKDVSSITNYIEKEKKMLKIIAYAVPVLLICILGVLIGILVKIK